MLDVLRGVPDFAWALLVYNFTGNGPLTGILAIAISVSGILGKIYSELWDSVDPRQYAALRSTGASRFVVLLYGIQPLAARGMLSFTLMRTVSCASSNLVTIEPLKPAEVIMSMRMARTPYMSATPSNGAVTENC